MKTDHKKLKKSEVDVGKSENFRNFPEISMHFYSWQAGLKTGIYYLRRKAKHQAQQFTIEPEKKDLGGQLIEETEDEICEMCSA